MKGFITIIFLLINSLIFGQTAAEVEQMINLNSSSKVESYSYARNAQNEYELMFSSMFLFYKNFISSQDGAHCTFTPSCSVYALKAIQKQGTVVGMINFFDRFARCNGFSSEHYEIDRKQNLLIDPVKNHKYE